MLYYYFLLLIFYESFLRHNMLIGFNDEKSK